MLHLVLNTVVTGPVTVTYQNSFDIKCGCKIRLPIDR